MIDAGLASRLAPFTLLAIAACAGAPPPEAPPAPPAPASAAPTAAPAPAPSASAAPTAAPSAAPTAQASAAPAAPPNPCPEGMAFIPGGEYQFAQTHEKVTVKPFCLDKSETTADEYDACVKGGKCDNNRLGVCDPSTFGQAGRGKMPMVCVDFPQAEKYCAAQGKRLATTEEWEWAARGASATSIHPWGEGDVGDQVCWSGKGARKLPCEVGSLPKGDSPQGVHDLLGGVREWTTLKTDATSSTRSVRGGSWTDSNKQLFEVHRHGVFKTTYRCGFVGIRCAQAAP